MIIQFVKYTRVWIAIAAITVVASVAALAVWGLKPHIDFTGGSLLEVSFSKDRPATEEVHGIFEGLNMKEAEIQKSSDMNLIIRTKALTEEQHQAVVKELRAKFQTGDREVREERFEMISPTVSKQLRTRSLWAILLVSISIVVYLAYAFRQASHPIASWQYGVIAIIALLHDVLLVTGIFAVLGHFKGVEVDVAFVVAMLTVLGYSVNDSIVVYDRIREHLLKRDYANFDELVNKGLNDTLMRSINTLFAVVLPLLALVFFGGQTVHYFALALLIGMISGTYSSLFVASPLLILLERRQRRVSA